MFEYNPHNISDLIPKSNSLTMENCCESLVKYFMVFFNILFIVAGGVLIGFGAWSQIDAKVRAVVKKNGLFTVRRTVRGFFLTTAL